jgi:hypothetical protein
MYLYPCHGVFQIASNFFSEQDSEFISFVLIFLLNYCLLVRTEQEILKRTDIITFQLASSGKESFEAATETSKSSHKHVKKKKIVSRVIEKSSAR